MSGPSCAETNYAEIVEILHEVCAEIHGYGEVTIRVGFHAGRPTTIDIIEKRRRHRLGQRTVEPISVTG